MKQNAFLGLRLPGEMNATIATQAQRFGQSRSVFVRKILELYLQAMKGGR